VRVNALREKVFSFEDLSEDQLDSVVVALKDLTESLSGAVAVKILECQVLCCLQMDTNHTPDTFENSLPHDKVVSELRLALIVQLAHAR